MSRGWPLHPWRGECATDLLCPRPRPATAAVTAIEPEWTEETTLGLIGQRVKAESPQRRSWPSIRPRRQRFQIVPRSGEVAKSVQPCSLLRLRSFAGNDSEVLWQAAPLPRNLRKFSVRSHFPPFSPVKSVCDVFPSLPYRFFTEMILGFPRHSPKFPAP